MRHLGSRVSGQFFSVAIITAALLLLGGCTRNFTFRTVDARSGAPLADVTAKRISDFEDVLLGSRHAQGQHGPSGVDGLIEAPRLPTDMSHVLIFHKAGYHNAEVQWVPGALGHSSYAVLLTPLSSSPDQKATKIPDSYTFTVPMYREGDSPDTRP